MENDKSDSITPQEAAQGVLRCTASSAVEFGWSSECDQAVAAARMLYEEHGPFELEWPYGIRKQEWYDDVDESVERVSR